MNDHFLFSHIGMRDVLRGYTLFVSKKTSEFKKLYKQEDIPREMFDEWISTYMNELKSSSIKQVEDELKEIIDK